MSFPNGALVLITASHYRGVRGIMHGRQHCIDCDEDCTDNDGCCWLIEMLDYEGDILSSDCYNDIDPPMIRVNEYYLQLLQH